MTPELSAALTGLIWALIPLVSAVVGWIIHAQGGKQTATQINGQIKQATDAVATATLAATTDAQKTAALTAATQTQTSATNPRTTGSIDMTLHGRTLRDDAP